MHFVQRKCHWKQLQDLMRLIYQSLDFVRDFPFSLSGAKCYFDKDIQASRIVIHNTDVSNLCAFPIFSFASVGWDKKVNLWDTETGQIKVGNVSIQFHQQSSVARRHFFPLGIR